MSEHRGLASGAFEFGRSSAGARMCGNQASRLGISALATLGLCVAASTEVSNWVALLDF